MVNTTTSELSLTALDINEPVWEHFFSVAPLVIIGTKEPEEGYDLAPKHMAMPLGWDNYFGFVCTPRHRTYQNICRDRVFTVSFVQPEQVVLASLAGTPHSCDGSKPALAVLPTFKASQVDGIFLKDAYLFLECELEKIVDGFGDNSLIAGKIIAAQVQSEALRVSGADEQDLVAHAPLMVYLSPGRYSTIERSFSFPFHKGFKR